ncbi:hypothetical protein HMPREF2141_00610 [Bacteroides uniformis]|uniref:Uncharacterized protein n=1 Tax=Bacteroides uniformis (strain ATCC 8492 / DSM 6597 / CCUG 4942 / CIP 103695 / JCM 5828 / KCTC 5204 / NCTC 13054 / VPI 0061) TaxID=411479 RepID=A0ABC9ND12_BACUC|nr:hypothetical protein BACUNI_01636 [Bacteroides uniformis ATCC 8492]KXT38495.1 hypothetical protein HMPREF2141_00610 [Bacteroides uniformis]
MRLQKICRTLQYDNRVGMYYFLLFLQCSILFVQAFSIYR